MELSRERISMDVGAMFETCASEGEVAKMANALIRDVTDLAQIRINGFWAKESCCERRKSDLPTINATE